MAKENKKRSGESGYVVNAWLLFLLAVVLLVAGWMMKSFPVLIFVALAPLFALSDKTDSDERFWSHAELILLALTLSLLAGHLFQMDFLISSIVQAIGFTLPFVGYGFVRHSLGPRVSKFTIIIFWMGVEYIFLKLQWPADHLFLADVVALKSDWINWTFHTGYLSLSLWILVVNLLFFLSFLKEGKLNGMWLGLFLAGLIAPILLSFTGDVQGIPRESMIALYSGAQEGLPSNYLKRGEFISRTAAWISVLIFIFALVKSKTRKK